MLLATKKKFSAKKRAITDGDITNILAIFTPPFCYLTIIFNSITDEQAQRLAPKLREAKLNRLKLSFNSISANSAEMILQQIATNRNLSVIDVTFGENKYSKKDLAGFLRPEREAPSAAEESLIENFSQLLIETTKDLSEVGDTVKDIVGDAVKDVGTSALNAFNYTKTLLNSCVPSTCMPPRNYAVDEKQNLAPLARKQKQS